MITLTSGWKMTVSAAPTFADRRPFNAMRASAVPAFAGVRVTGDRNAGSRHIGNRISA
jgi:hypothetical protein